MNKQDREELKELISRELRENALTNVPVSPMMPPWDQEAEVTVIAALMSLERTLEEAPGLRAEHFLTPLYRWIFEQRCNSEQIALTAGASRLSGEFIRDQISPLMFQPWCSAEAFSVAVARIIERADARALVERLRRAVAGLCCDTLTVQQVRAGLARL